MSQGAQQPAPRPRVANVEIPGENLSLNEMLRVMDVAREMGRDRATAEKMFQQEGVRAQIREKLLRSARLSGDQVTEAEIDAAIDQYFAGLNVYQDPPLNFNKMLAYAWIWSRYLTAAAGAVAAMVAMIWFLFFSSVAPLNPAVQSRKSLAEKVAQAEGLSQQIKAIAEDPAALQRAASLQAQVLSADAGNQAVAVTAIQQLKDLHQQLATEYDIRIVSGGTAASMLHREARNDQTGRYRTAGYYVVVEAVSPEGTVLTLPIRNAETGRVDRVDRWAERVPKEVYDRLAEDKRSDGVLNETEFSQKQRGRMEPVIRLPGPAGEPITLSAQLTQLDVPR
ncbi:hypothetical protein FF011L_54000 [Roseimaritima multifibrata]|uniref:Uncharacterized protein n=1 Tax=Roseimaritima multifibrata TaxID=1930274 RepID=A0A517MNX8_9BACT|nr:DUF6384 family protein [Roseimaritima multifibrata]QDS96588.1 hypothetical protein FF011L_54000 [Roseimaritima multifibrata]